MELLLKKGGTKDRDQVSGSQFLPWTPRSLPCHSCPEPDAFPATSSHFQTMAAVSLLPRRHLLAPSGDRALWSCPVHFNTLAQPFIIARLLPSWPPESHTSNLVGDGDFVGSGSRLLRLRQRPPSHLDHTGPLCTELHGYTRSFQNKKCPLIS